MPSTTLRIDGKALRRLRTLRGFTLEELAQAAGLGRTTVGRLERGSGELIARSLLRLAIALDASPCDLIRLDEEDAA